MLSKIMSQSSHSSGDAECVRAGNGPSKPSEVSREERQSLMVVEAAQNNAFIHLVLFNLIKLLINAVL